MVALRDLDPAVWSELEFGACPLGHKKRTRRLVTYAEQMAEKPDASTPKQTESWADCKAVYRLFQRPEVTFGSVTATHYQRTRNLEPGTYLVIGDTTELDYGYDSPRRRLGRLTAEKHRGFFLHTALVLGAEDGAVIGVGAQVLFTRSLPKKPRVKRVGGCKRASEAEVWEKVIDQYNRGLPRASAYPRAIEEPTILTFAHLKVKGDSWVIRAAQLTRKVRYGDEVLKLGKALELADVLGSYQVYVAPTASSRSVGRRSKSARPRLPCCAARGLDGLRQESRDPRDLDACRRDSELRSPKNQQALRWVLYTREPASTFQEAIRVVGHYEQRPHVEEYHKCLKTGLAVECRRYQSGDRLEPVIGMICVQAVRLLQLRHSLATARHASEGFRAHGMAGNDAKHRQASCRHPYRSIFPPYRGRLGRFSRKKVRR